MKYHRLGGVGDKVQMCSLPCASIACDITSLRMRLWKGKGYNLVTIEWSHLSCVLKNTCLTLSMDFELFRSLNILFLISKSERVQIYTIAAILKQTPKIIC